MSDNQKITYTLIRSQRKTLSVRITNDAELEVRAPVGLPKHEIDKFLNSKQTWIAGHLEKRKILIELKAEFTTDYGSLIMLCGKEYPIRSKAGSKAGFDETCFYVPPDLPKESVKRAIIQTYKLLANRILTYKTNEFSIRMNVKPMAVKINSAKTRWGSCSGKNSINYSWRLIMASDAVIDYVVVHELAHIKEHNHSARFWAVVSGIIPDYERCRSELKILQDKLNSEDWN